MATLNLSLSKKNPVELIALGTLVAGRLAPAAPAVPPLGDMSAVAGDLLAATTDAMQANKVYEDAKSALRNLKESRDAAVDALRREHTAAAAAVSSKAKGDPILLTASGYELASVPMASSEVPAKVSNLSISAGDADGHLDGQHDPSARAVSYEAQLTSVDPVAGPWETVSQQTASSFSLTGLTSGQRVWVRVRGVGSNGNGPWSDPFTKIVP